MTMAVGPWGCAGIRPLSASPRPDRLLIPGLPGTPWAYFDVRRRAVWALWGFRPERRPCLGDWGVGDLLGRAVCHRTSVLDRRQRGRVATERPRGRPLATGPGRRHACGARPRRSPPDGPVSTLGAR